MSADRQGCEFTVPATSCRSRTTASEPVRWHLERDLAVLPANSIASHRRIMVSEAGALST